MIDLALLQIIKYREQFEKVKRYIPLKTSSGIDKRTKAVALDIEKYFEMNPDESKLDFPSFRSMFFTTFHKNLSEGDIEFYNNLLTRMERDVSESIKKNIVNQLLELQYVTDVANIVQEYEQGEEIEAVTCIDNLTTAIKDARERSNAHEYADILDCTVGTENADTGLKWPLQVMNDTYRDIQGGDQYIIAARPGKGKTSFLTFLNWSLAQQMPKDQVIVWFNNESRRQRIITRQLMSALNATDSELQQMQKDGTMVDKYVEAMGSKDRVRVYDIHGKNNSYLEEVLENIGVGKVGAIICDMLDNVGFPTRTDVREDQRLERLYQWLRERGVEYNCPTFPTSQISNEGAGLMFPTENMLKDSKTGKQGACDGIIMIGSSDDPLLQRTRGISMPKTKSKREGMADMREEILFDSDRGRFK